MGQEQYRSGKGEKMEEKEATPAKDRATAGEFERRIENNPAMKWGSGKPNPASKPT